MPVEEKAKQYALEAWGEFINDNINATDAITDSTLGEISEKDFTEGYKAGLGDASFDKGQMQRKFDILLKTLDEINDISNDINVLSKIERVLKKVQSLPKINSLNS